MKIMKDMQRQFIEREMQMTFKNLWHCQIYTEVERLV